MRMKESSYKGEAKSIVWRKGALNAWKNTDWLYIKICFVPQGPLKSLLIHLLPEPCVSGFTRGQDVYDDKTQRMMTVLQRDKNQ